jgi:cytochrome c oxidase cbb3-type subunit 4
MNLDSLLIDLRSLWTVWMMVMFLGVVVYALWPGNQRRFDEAASIPLRDDGQEV